MEPPGIPGRFTNVEFKILDGNTVGVRNSEAESKEFARFVRQ